MLSMLCGILNILQTDRPPRPVTGIALLLYAHKIEAHGSVVAEALRYKPECRGFGPDEVNGFFQFT
jgi:hypothetical protein